MVRPDPVAFQRWQNGMTQAGIALLVALALCAVMVWAALAWAVRESSANVIRHSPPAPAPSR